MWMPEDPGQAAGIPAQHGAEPPLAHPIPPTVSPHRLRLQDTRAQHGNRRERYEQRYQNCHRQGDGEFTKQPAEHPAHQKNRDEYCHQRESHRDDREGDIPCASQGRLHGRYALFAIACDIFQHDDRVVYHKPRRNRERHERQIVKAITQHVHDTERRDQRHGNGHGRNQGGPHIAEKREHHENHEGDGNGESPFDIMQRRANDGRPIHHDGQGHTPRKGRFQLRQARAKTIHGFNDVRASLPIDDHQDGRRAVRYPHGSQIFDRRLHRRHIGQLHGAPVSIGHDQRQIVLGFVQLIIGLDFPCTIVRRQLAFRTIHIGAAQNLAHLSQPDAVLVQGGGIEIHTDRRQ